MLKKHKKQLKYAVIILVVLAIVLGGVFAYQQITRSQTQTQTPHTNPINYNAPTEQEKQAGEKAKIDHIENDNQSTTPPAGDGDKAIITNFTQDSATKAVTIQTELMGNDFLSCTLTLTSGSNTITKTAEVIYQNSFSTCAGFTIQGTEFESGTWSAKITVNKANGNTVSSETSQANITK